jgi:hypothetical protein
MLVQRIRRLKILRTTKGAKNASLRSVAVFVVILLYIGQPLGKAKRLQWEARFAKSRQS